MPPFKGAVYNKRPRSALELEERARGRKEAQRRYHTHSREARNKQKREYNKKRYEKLKQERLLLRANNIPESAKEKRDIEQRRKYNRERYAKMKREQLLHKANDTTYASPEAKLPSDSY